MKTRKHRIVHRFIATAFACSLTAFHTLFPSAKGKEMRPFPARVAHGAHCAFAPRVSAVVTQATETQGVAAAHTSFHGSTTTARD